MLPTQYRSDARLDDRNAASGIPRPSESPEVRWLQEEDDLASKLNRLLRRQAKRRGVDLS